jgi:hypothetical protein
VLDQISISDEIFNLYLKTVLTKHGLMSTEGKHPAYQYTYLLYFNVGHSYLEMIGIHNESFARDTAVEQFKSFGLKIQHAINVLNEFFDLLNHQNFEEYVEYTEPLA